MRFCLLLLASLAFADVRDCACDAAKPETMEARECGLCREAEKQTGDAQVFFYDQAGTKVGECSAPKDATIKVPRPLQVSVSGGKARLELGVYGLDIQ